MTTWIPTITVDELRKMIEGVEGDRLVVIDVGWGNGLPLEAVRQSTMTCDADDFQIHPVLALCTSKHHCKGCKPHE